MARRADRPNQVKAAVNPHRFINARIVPAPSVRNHLTSLVGTTIPTITGRPNRIVGIEGANVIVATQRSPEGEPVALSAVQTAADRVFDGEVVRIDPATVGFRSAFVGAVLQSMPGVEVLRNPPRASLRTPPADLNDVDAFLRTVGEPLEDPMTGHRFRIVATRPGGATYQRFNGTRQNTVSTEILQAILTEVSERADASESFTLGVDPRFWTDHGHFANAVIAGINYSLFRWPFNGLEPDATASLGRTLHAEAPSAEGGRSKETHAARRGVEPVGVPYRPADELVSVAEHDPVEMDPDVIGRGKRSHARLQNQLAAQVAAAGLTPLSPSADHAPFDVAWRDGTDMHVAEVKSTTETNEEHQLRLGLGQLLRYRHALAADGATVHATLYVERTPVDPRWSELCESLGITLRWPPP